MHNERINERGSYIFLEWSCTNKIIKSVGILNSGRMVVLNASVKIPERDGKFKIPLCNPSGGNLIRQSHI